MANMIQKYYKKMLEKNEETMREMCEADKIQIEAWRDKKEALQTELNNLKDQASCQEEEKAIAKEWAKWKKKHAEEKWSGYLRKKKAEEYLLRIRIRNMSNLSKRTLKILRLRKVGEVPNKKRSRKKNASLERFATGAFCLFPRKSREEWLGDTLEVIAKLRTDGYSRPILWGIMIGKLLILLIVTLKIKLGDFFPAKSSNPQD